MKEKLPPDEYYKSLAKVPTAGGAIIRNTKGEFLIVKNPYRENYGVPGGMTEKKETVRAAVIREVKEELGIDISNPRLFCVDFDVREPYDRILFLFDCGIINDEMIKSIKIDKDEIESFTFVKYEEMIKMLHQRIQKRIINSIDSFRKGGLIYLESGEIVS